MPVAEQGVLRRKYNAMGIVLAQLPLFSVSLEIMAFNVRCSLSTTPFPCGWYGEENTCWIPWLQTHFLKKSPLNWGPLSLVSPAGNPHLVNIPMRAVVITLAVVDQRGIASGHLVAKSITVSRYLNPPTAVGNGPTRLIEIFSNGMLELSLICMGLCLTADLSCF